MERNADPIFLQAQSAIEEALDATDYHLATES